MLVEHANCGHVVAKPASRRLLENHVRIFTSQATDDAEEGLVMPPVIAFNETVSQGLGRLTAVRGVKIVAVEIKLVVLDDAFEFLLEIGGCLGNREVQDGSRRSRLFRVGCKPEVHVTEPLGMLLVNLAV